MALDFMSDVEDRFMQDNLLSSEDWGDPTCNYFNEDQLRVDDLVNDNRFQCAEEGHIKNTPSACEELLAPDAPSSELTCDDLNVDLAKAWLGIADEVQLHGMNGYPIKNEPLSPPPSSESSDSSSESGHGSQVLQNGNLNQVHIKLESPPLTPPRESPGNSPSPLGGHGQKAFFTISNGGLPNGVSKSLASGVINGTKKGVAIAPKPMKGVIQLPLASAKLEPKVSIPSQTHAKSTVTIKHIPATAGGQPIVLKHSNPSSPFTTAQGSCLPPPVKQAKMQSNIPSPTHPVAIVTQPCPPNLDVKVWKRQQRMIKNRESACLSRKKKKEYVTELECKAEGLEKELQRLRSENLSLRSKVEALVKENSTLKKMHSSLFSSPAKTATCLLVVVCIIGFNLAPLSLFSPSSDGVGTTYDTSHHAGRALLGFTELLEANTSRRADDDPSVAARHSTIHDLIEDIRFMGTVGNESSSSSTSLSSSAARDVVMATMRELSYLLPQGNQSCFHEMNITDTLRLQDVLQFWAKRQLEDKKTKRKEEQEKKKSKRKRYQPFHKRFGSGPTLHVESAERSLQLYDHLFQRSYDNLLDALDRREDTFYVVSFRNDHLLLPATTRNITHRPKMSLVMPTVSGNESVWNTPKDHISMMQIDCEVIDTHVVHVKDQATSRPPVVQNETAYASPLHSASPLHNAPSAEQKEHKIDYHPRNLTSNVTP